MKDEQNSIVLNQSQGFNVSEKYKTVKTQDIIQKLTDQGFKVNSTVVTKPRKVEKEGFQKHMIRLSHNEMSLKNVNDSRPELVIVNSHDASTSIKFLIGIFRLVCANGLIVGKTFGGTSIRHTGDVFPKIDKALDDIRIRLPMVAEKINLFQSIQLNDSKMKELASEAIKLVIPEKALNVDLYSVLKFKRYEDSNTDLWTIYNRIQENFLRGGVQYQTEMVVDNNTFIRNNSSRAIKSIDRQLEVNRKLWDLTEKFSKVA